jgi:2'-5' RNA ligase
VTLKFLGDVDEHDLPRVVSAVAEASAGLPPFHFETTRLGAFPSPRNPRVLWVGVTPVDELFDLQQALESGLAEIGFPRERRGFHPHITVGRVRGRAPDTTGETLSGLLLPQESVDVTEVRVMRSTLDPRGAIHEVIESVPLGGKGKNG